jgi:sigma-B regulation protein RsbU (phosphoserine phosphatase)
MDFVKLNSISDKINSRLALADLLRSIMDTAKDVLNSEGASLLLYDSNAEDLIFNIVIGEKGDIIQGERIPEGRGIAGTVAKTGEPLIVNDAIKDPRFFKEIDRKSDFCTRNILCIPMKVMGTLIGVLEIVNSIGRVEFSDEDLEVGRLIANQAAIAIDNRRLYDDLNNRVHELTTLYQVSQALSLTKKETTKIFMEVIDLIKKSLKAKRASFFIVNESGIFLDLIASSGLPENIEEGYAIPAIGSISAHVFLCADPMIVSDINTDLPESLRVSSGEYLTSSFISVPVIVNNVSIGVLNVADKENGFCFDSFDLRVLSTAATQVGEAFQNLKHYKDSLLRQRLNDEISIAAELQRKIIPKLPKIYAGHKMSAFNMPAKVVGGDFYDFFILEENKYGILVADVSGKGIPAAMFMGVARNIIRSEGRIHKMPAPLLQQSNKYIFHDSEHGMFVTMFYATIDAHNRLITYGSAGHNNQFLVRHDSDVVERLNAAGKPLGIHENSIFEERIVLFNHGDILVLCTDGVIETFDDSADISLAEEAIVKKIRSMKDRDPDDIIAMICEEGGAGSSEELEDDFTILVIKF